MRRVYKELYEKREICIRMRGYEFEVSFEEIPEGLQEVNASMYRLEFEIVTRCVRSGCCYLSLNAHGNIMIHKPPRVTVIPQELLYMGLNSWGSPIFMVDGIKCSGYKSISLEIFGVKRDSDFLDYILKPYIVKSDLKNPDIKKFYLVTMKKGYKKKPYPIIGYENLRFNGFKQLKESLGEWLTKERQEIIAGRLEIPRQTNKLDNILQTFQPIFTRNSYLFLNPDIQMGEKGWLMLCSYKKDLVDFIKGHPQGYKNLSKGLASELFKRIMEKTNYENQPSYKDLLSGKAEWVNLYEESESST